MGDGWYLINSPGERSREQVEAFSIWILEEAGGVIAGRIYGGRRRKLLLLINGALWWMSEFLLDKRTGRNLREGTRGQVARPGKTLTVTTGEVVALKDGKKTPCAIMQQTIVRIIGRPGVTN